MTRIRRYRKYILPLIFPAVIWLLVNFAINRHTHRLKSGHTITHAHPFNKQNSGNKTTPFHSHTDIDILFLELITGILLIVSWGISLAIRKQAAFHKIIPQNSVNTPSRIHLIPEKRGPPVPPQFKF